jgi:hypothetical protein
MPEQREYYIEQLNETRLVDLVTLHYAVYRRTVSPEFYRRKYATAYTGKQYIGFLAYNNNHEPVGYYGVIPCFLRYNDAKLLAAQSADTMTHPGYRFKGLFVELANLCYDLCRKEGIYLIFGFPNQHSYHGAVNKLGWQIAGQMDCFTIDVPALPFAKLAGKTAVTRGWYERYVNHLLQKHHTTEFPDTPAVEGYNGVCRNSDHRKYKTYHSHYFLQLDNMICWIRLQDALVIGDMMLTGEKDFSKAIIAIKQLASRLGFRQIQYHINQETDMHRLFAAQFHPVPTFPVLFRDLGFGRSLDRFRFSLADIDIF